MLGCGARVRIIALPHVRCACGSACGKVLEVCVRKCVRTGIFSKCDLRSHFLTCSDVKSKKNKPIFIRSVLKVGSIYEKSGSFDFQLVFKHQNYS